MSTDSLDLLAVWTPPRCADQVRAAVSLAGGDVLTERVDRGYVVVEVYGELADLLRAVPALRQVREICPALEWSLDG